MTWADARREMKAGMAVRRSGWMPQVCIHWEDGRAVYVTQNREYHPGNEAQRTRDWELMPEADVPVKLAKGNYRPNNISKTAEHQYANAIVACLTLAREASPQLVVEMENAVFAETGCRWQLPAP